MVQLYYITKKRRIKFDLDTSYIPFKRYNTIKDLREKIFINQMRNYRANDEDSLKTFIDEGRLFLDPELLVIVDDYREPKKEGILLEDYEEINFIYLKDLIIEELANNISNIDTSAILNKNSIYFENFHKKFLTLNDNISRDTLLSLVKISFYDIYDALYSQFSEEAYNFYRKRLEYLRKIEEEHLIFKEDLKHLEGVARFSLEGDKDVKLFYNISNSITTIENFYSKKISDKVIINGIKLDKNMPFLYAYNFEKREPVLKIYKGFPVEKVKEFVSSKYDSSKNVIGNNKSINIKFLNKKTDTFSSITIANRSNRITIRCNFKKISNYSFDKLLKCSNTGLNIMRQLKTISMKNYNEDRTCKNFKTFFTSTSINIILDTYIEPEVILANISKSNYFFIKQKKSSSSSYITNNTLVLYYSDKENRNDEKYATVMIRSNKILNNQDNNYYYYSVLDVSGINNEKEFYKMFILFCKFIKQVSKNKTIIKEEKLKNIKKIKKISGGLKLDPVNCPKERQPILSEKGSISSGRSIKSGKFYYNCSNEDYPFTGFTNKGSVCCFKRDQRKNKKYQEYVSKYITDKESINKRSSIKKQVSINTKTILKKNVILSPNRLGIVSDIFLKNLFEEEQDSFYRVGVEQDKGISFLNVFNSLLDENISIKDLEKFLYRNKNVFHLLKTTKGEKISNTFTLSSFIKFLKGEEEENKTLEPIGDNYLSELLSSYFSLNLIILDESQYQKETVRCKYYTNNPMFENFIIVIKKTPSNYEGIVKLNKKDKKIIKLFKRGDRIIEKVLDFYSKLCLFEKTKPSSLIHLLEYPFKIKYQYMNKFDKITYILTAKHGFIPVYPSDPIQGVAIKEKIEIKDLLEMKEQCDLLSNTDIESLKIKGMISYKGNFVGLLLNSDIITPVKPKKIEGLKDRQVFEKNISYVFDIDTFLYSGNKIEDKLSIYSSRVDYYVELFQRFRYFLSEYFKKNSSIKNKILETLEADNYTGFKKNIETLLKDKVKISEKPSKFPSKIPSTRDICEKNNRLKDPFCYKDKLVVEKENLSNIIVKLYKDMKRNSDIVRGIVSEDTGIEEYVSKKNNVFFKNNEEIINFLKEK